MYTEYSRPRIGEEVLWKEKSKKTIPHPERTQPATEGFYRLEDLVSTDVERAFPQVDVGLFFGAYDPPHWGHGLTAKHVRETTGMKEVWFVPSAFHRFGKNMSSIPERVEMLKVLRNEIGGLPEYRVTPLESHFDITDGKANRVLQALKLQPQPDGAPIEKSKFGIILGLDNHARFHEWWQASEILKTVPIFFAARPGSVVPKQIHHNMYLVPDFEGNSRNFASTIIRNDFKEEKGSDLSSLLPSEVVDYIRQHNLYSPEKNYINEGSLR